MDWQDRVSRQGAENWKRAVLRRAAEWEVDRDAFYAWARTPRGRATIALRRIRTAPWRFRYWLAALIYPGDLDPYRDY